jgi:hypothetical protein
VGIFVTVRIGKVKVPYPILRRFTSTRKVTYHYPQGEETSFTPTGPLAMPITLMILAR